MDTMLTTKSTLPCRFKSWISCAPHSAPAMVPVAMIKPSFRSTLPRARCRLGRHHRLADDMRQIGADGEVPVHPDCLNAGPAMKLPPTPKNPPRTPIRKPITTR